MSGKIKVAPQYRNQFLFEDEVTTRGNRVYVTPKQVPDADLATSDTAYAYAGQLPTVSVTAERKQVSSAGVTEWANEAAKDPSVLFNPIYKKYREALPLSAWVKIMEKHPDWWTKETSKYIPENVQSALFNRGIRQATDKAASTIAPLVIGFTNPLAAVAGVVGATAVDEGISAASGGKYQGFADAMELTVGRPISDLFISPDLNNSHFWNVVHPGAIAMGLGATKAVPTAELSYTPLQRVRNPKTGRIELVETPDVTWRFGGDALKGLAELYGSTDRVVLLTPSVVKGKSTTGFNNGKVSGGSFRWNNTTRYRSGHGNGQPHGRGQQTFDVQWTPQEVPYREYSGSFNLPNRVFWPTYFTSPTQLQGTTVSPAPTKLITIPQMYTWQTVTRRAGSPEFNQWFRELYQQNPGGVASGPWGDIRLNLAPRRFNIEGGQYAPGFYTSGAATSVEGLPLIILDPYSNPPYNRAGITEAGATIAPITTGATVSFKQGGLLMRKGGRIVEVPYYLEGTNKGGGIKQSHTYRSDSKEEEIPEEVLIDRSGQHPRYTYIAPSPIRLAYFKTYSIKPATYGKLKLGPNGEIIHDISNELTDEASYDYLRYNQAPLRGAWDRGVEYSYPTGSERYRYIFEGVPVGVNTTYSPAKDVYLFPDGTSRTVKRPTVKKEPEPISYLPIEVPSLRNDNTSTSGSILPGPITYMPGIPDQRAIEAPEGYNPADEWEHGTENVNGGVREFWKNKKTGKIVRIKPY